MKHVALGLFVASLVVNEAAAGFMTRTGAAVYSLHWNGQEYIGLGDANYWTAGGTPLGSVANATAGLSNAVAKVRLDTGIHLTAASMTSSGQYQSGSALAVGAWQDVVRLNHTSPPASLLVTFDVKGWIGTSAPQPDAVSNVQMGLTMFPNPVWEGVYGGDQLEAAWRWAHQLPTSHVGVLDQFPPYPDSPQGPVHWMEPDGTVNWQASFEIPYISSLNGYYMHVYASVAASVNGWYLNHGGSVVAIGDFGSTIRLTSLTHLDGSPIDGTVTFDSGFTLPSDVNPVPEPSSLALLGMGVTGLCGYRIRRKRHQAV